MMVHSCHIFTVELQNESKKGTLKNEWHLMAILRLY